MYSILITTDFSAASKHSLDYTCMLLHDKEVQLHLLHVYSVPINYTADGIALISVNDAIAHANAQLDDELERISEDYPQLSLQGKVLTGPQKDVLVEEIEALQPLFVVISTSGYEDIFPGDPDPLEILRSLNAPVLFVPVNAPLIPIRNAAYACNYSYVGPETPTSEIMEWVQFMNAQLHVVHTDAHSKGADEIQNQGEAWLKETLASLEPQFHWIQDENVLQGMSHFIEAGHADCIVIVPRRFGIWENLFHHSQTKALARLNKIPVLAFHNQLK